MPLQIRRGTEAEREVLAVPPAEGELIWITDDRRLYIGDGTTLAVDLTAVTGYNDADARDAAASIFDDSVTPRHTNITFTYDSGNDQMTAAVDLSNYDGVITASSFNGSIVADDSTDLVDATNGSINLDGTVKGDITPDVDEAYDIGSSSAKFKDIWLSGSSIHLGSATITSSGSSVNLPAGSTVGGAPIGPSAMSGNSLNVDIIGDDSSVIVNSSTGTVTGNFNGDLTGSVFGDTSTLIIDGVDNSVYATFIETSDFTSPTNYFNFGSADDAATKFMYQFAPTPASTRKVDGIVDADDGPGDFINVSRGTLNAKTAVQGGDVIRQDLNFAHDGTGYVIATGVVSLVDPNGTISTGNMPGLLALSTFDDGDGDNPHGIVIESNGWTSINRGINAAVSTFDNNGFMIIEPQTAAPASPVDGMIAIADGANWDPSGSNPTKKQMVVYFGGWVQIAIQP
jgi:hypothetical protein